MRTTKQTGFTIVELLIVIVVIAILAAISIVAYNGIQNRANNSKTVAAVSAYVKAIQLYKIDNGMHPDVTSCLGTGYPSSMCRNDNSVFSENNGNFNTVILKPYFNGTVPSPAMKTVDYNSTITMSGAFYQYNNPSYNPNGGGLGVVFIGIGTCPVIGSTTYSSSTQTGDGLGILCRYMIN